MKETLILLGLIIGIPAIAAISPPPVYEASQVETDAGVVGSKYVSPRRLGAWSGGGGATNANAMARTNGIGYSGWTLETGNARIKANLQVDGELDVATFVATNASFINVITDGYSVRTNLFVMNGVLYRGTNFTYTGGAQTGGITGIGGTTANTEWYSQITIKSTGDIVFTNPATFYTSDGVDTRTFTNGNLTTIAVQIIPGFSTNLTYSWSR